MIPFVARARHLLLVVGLLVMANAAWAGAGDLLWEDRHVPAVPLFEGGLVVASGNRVFTAGHLNPSVNTSASLFRAYDAKTGRLVWSDSGLGHVSSIAEADGRVFAAGSSLRAYGFRRGNLLWANNTSAGHVAATKSTVFVTGAGFGAFLVRAYAAETGVLLWESRTPGLTASRLAEAGGRIFVVGLNGGVTGSVLRALDARTGALLWELDRAGSRLIAVAGHGSRVFTVGSSGDLSSGPGDDLLVAVYDASSGTLLWEDIAANVVPPPTCLDPFDQVGLVSCFDIGLVVEPEGGRMFVAGESQNPATGATARFIRAYAIRTGEILWQDLVPSTLELFRPISLVAGKGRVFMVSRLGPAPSPFMCLLRAYDARTGSIEWEDPLDGYVGELALAGKELLTAGTTQDGEFWVRAYDAR